MIYIEASFIHFFGLFSVLKYRCYGNVDLDFHFFPLGYLYINSRYKYYVSLSFEHELWVIDMFIDMFLSSLLLALLSCFSLFLHVWLCDLGIISIILFQAPVMVPILRRWRSVNTASTSVNFVGK